MATSTKPPAPPTKTPASTDPTVTPQVEVTPSNPVISAGKFSNIQEELDIMLKYAINNGISLPTTFAANNNPDSNAVINNYNSLVATIAPATVQSISYINSQIIENDRPKSWYRIPLFAKCLTLALISLLILISISLSPTVNQDNLAEGLLASSGFTLLYNLLFILSASMLGVMFFLLKTISTKIKNYTLLPVDGIELNATILIGLISGFIISELFTFTTTTIGGSIEVNKMTLALLGGFSSDAIFTILQGIVNKVKLFLTPAA